MTGRRYAPPPVGEVSHVGYAGVVVEVGPNQFVEIIMEVRLGDPADGFRVDVERKVETIFDGPLTPIYVPLDMRGEVLLRGRLISREELRERPAWATAPQPEIEARREIEP